MADLPAPIQMLQLLSGFQVSQSLFVAARLGVSDQLTEGPLTVEELAARTEAQPLQLRRLLRMLASIGVYVELEQDTFALNPLGETLTSGSPWSMRDLALLWMETHYGPFGELLHTVQTGEAAAEHFYGQPFFDWLADKPEHVARFTRAMADLTNALKVGALDSINLGGARLVVDVGGADGSLLASLIDCHPGVRGVVFDLPHVVGAARDIVRERGLIDRIDVVSGDFFDGVPVGADVYLLSMVLHDWSDEEATRILCKVAAAGGTGTELRVLELVVPGGNRPHPSKVADLTMLAMSTGRERTEREWSALLQASGFRLDAVIRTPTPLRVLEATAT